MMITDSPNQPRDYDAVLGGQNPVPDTAVVLGGLAGLKARFQKGDGATKVAEIKNSLKYGKPGVEFLLECLKDSADDVRREAYLLLKKLKEPEVIEGLKGFNFYRFWDCIRTIKVGKNVTISPEGSRMVFSHEKLIKIAEIARQKLLYSIDPLVRVKGLFLLGEEPDLFVRSVDTPRRSVIEVWLSQDLEHTLIGHENEISTIALSSDNKMLGSGSLDKTVRLWNIETGKLIYTFGTYLTWGSHKDAIVSVAFSPDGKILASASRDGMIKLWNLRTMDRPQTIQSDSSYLVFTPDSSCLAFSPDGQTLASTTRDGKIKLWNALSQEIKLIIDAFLGSKVAIAWSPDGKILASSCVDNTIKLWNSLNGRLIFTLPGHEDAISCLAFNQKGDTIISGSLDKTIKIWGVN